MKNKMPQNNRCIQKTISYATLKYDGSDGNGTDWID